MTGPKIEQKIGKIENLILQGNYPHIAAQASGIHERTWERWLKRGEDALNAIDIDIVDEYEALLCLPASEQLYARIALLTKKAEARAECTDVQHINQGNKDAIPRLAKLSRRHPQRWAERRGEDESLKAGLAFLGRLAEALRKPQIETTEPPEKPPLLT